MGLEINNWPCSLYKPIPDTNIDIEINVYLLKYVRANFGGKV